MCTSILPTEAYTGAQHKQLAHHAPSCPAATSRTKVHWFHCLVTDQQRNYVLTLSGAGDLQDSHKQGHRPTDDIPTHSSTVRCEPHSPHTLLQGPVCTILSPKHLLVMAAHLVTPDPTVAQFHTQVRGGGVEVTAPIKPLQAAVVAVDNFQRPLAAHMEQSAARTGGFKFIYWTLFYEDP